jgi:MFS family permease
MNLGRTTRVYATTLSSPSLRRVLGAFFVFSAMEYAVWLAVTLYAFERGGATAAGAVLIVQLLPAAVVAPFGSALGDRMSRGRALSLGYVAQAVADLSLGLAMLTAPSLVVYGAAVVASCAVTLTRPVHNAILPDLARTPDQLTASNSVSGSAEGLGMLIGPLLAGLVVAIWGTSAVPLAFGGLMGLAALLTARLSLSEGRPVLADQERGGNLVREAAEGLSELRRDRDAAVLTVLGGTQFLVLGMLDVFFALLAIEILEVGAARAGPLSAAVGLGGLLGAGATAALIGRSRLAAPVEAALALTGVALALVAFTPGYAAAMVLLAGVGAARAFFDVAARTLLQRSVRAEVLSRVFGLQEALTMLGTAAGAAIVPIVVALFGNRGAFLVAGSIAPVAAAASFGALRRLDGRAEIPDAARVAVLRSLPLFQPLAPGPLEQVARQLVPEVRAPGDVLIREGAPGDRFFILVEGRVAISTRRAGVVTEVGPGSPLGEIALLRNVPRTATVTALTDVHLLALERDAFLEAVTGLHRPSGVVDRSIDRRLGELGGPSTDR